MAVPENPTFTSLVKLKRECDEAFGANVPGYQQALFTREVADALLEDVPVFVKSKPDGTLDADAFMGMPLKIQTPGEIAFAVGVAISEGRKVAVWKEDNGNFVAAMIEGRV